MNDLHAARADLAFMKELAEDRGPLPPIVGMHMLAVGVLFGANVVYTWAVMRGLLPRVDNWTVWSWAPATVVYVPLVLWFSVIQARGGPLGPAARAFAAAWSGVGIMTAVIVAILTIASFKAHQPIFFTVWPAIALALYGGAWCCLALIRRRYWSFGVGVGCFATAIGCALLIGEPEHWLVMGLGMILFLGGPGLAILRAARA
jgi:hypothetical protein